jgi:hypothetical protein
MHVCIYAYPRSRETSPERRVSLWWRRRSSPEEKAGGGCSPEQGIETGESCACVGWPAGGGKKIENISTAESWEEGKTGEGRKLSGRRRKRGSRGRNMLAWEWGELQCRDEGGKRSGGRKRKAGGGGVRASWGHTSPPPPIPNVEGTCTSPFGDAW